MYPDLQPDVNEFVRPAATELRLMNGSQSLLGGHWRTLTDVEVVEDTATTKTN